MEDYNVFKVLNLERKETVHSAMIASIIAHDKKCWESFFARLKGKDKTFGKAIDSMLGTINFDSNIDGHWIKTEVQLRESVDGKNRNRGRADIWIGTNRKEEKQYRLIIENKIDAGNQYRQLSRYYRYLTGDTREFAGLFFLCVNRSKEYINQAIESAKEFNSETKKGEATQYAIITYEDDIIPWLYDVWKESTGDFKKAVADYLELVGELTGKKINEIYPQFKSVR